MPIPTIEDPASQAPDVVTRNGVPVGELVPLRARQFVAAEAALAAFAGAPSFATDQLRSDLDAILDQDPTPRG